MTSPYTPQHNGVAKRRNKTILDMVISIMNGKKMSHHFWGEAVSTTTYILNRSPTKRLKGITPEEAWSGNMLDVSNF